MDHPGQPVKFETYEEFQVWMASIDPLDKYGFHQQQWDYWNPETPEKELDRIEMNLLYYREFIKNGAKFPPEVHEKRRFEFHRARELNGYRSG